MFKFILFFGLALTTVLSAPYYVTPVHDVQYYGYNYPVATSYSSRYEYHPYSQGKKITNNCILNSFILFPHLRNRKIRFNIFSKPEIYSNSFNFPTNPILQFLKVSMSFWFVAFS